MKFKNEFLLWTSPRCLVTSFWTVLSTGVTGGGGGGGMKGLRVGAGGLLVGTAGFWVGTNGLLGGGVTLFGGRGALVVVVDDVVVLAVVDLGITGKTLFWVTGGRTVVLVLFPFISGM